MALNPLTIAAATFVATKVISVTVLIAFPKQRRKMLDTGRKVLRRVAPRRTKP